MGVGGGRQVGGQPKRGSLTQSAAVAVAVAAAIVVIVTVALRSLLLSTGND